MDRAFIVVGLGYGDEAKGATVDWITRREGARLVVLFNGGGQRAHTVVDGAFKHTFRQFGSGTFAGADTHHSRFCMVDPATMVLEAEQLQKLRHPAIYDQPLDHLTIHERCAVTTPWHVALNRLRELSGTPHGTASGSCGLGIAETMRDVLAHKALHYEELLGPDLERRLREIREDKQHAARLLPVHECELWEQAWAAMFADEAMDAILEVFDTVAGFVPAVAESPRSKVTVFEGSQGILLDEWAGFGPHHTWSRCTSENARRLLTGQETTVLGVTRAYATRHGRGPLVTEDRLLSLVLEDPDNSHNHWQGEMRYGWPDLYALRYALSFDGHVDGLVVTCADQVEALADQLPTWHVATHYSPPGLLGKLPRNTVTDRQRTRALFRAEPRYSLASAPEVLPQTLSGGAGVPLYAISRGPAADSTERLESAHSVR